MDCHNNKFINVLFRYHTWTSQTRHWNWLYCFIYFIINLALWGLFANPNTVVNLHEITHPGHVDNGRIFWMKIVTVHDSDVAWASWRHKPTNGLFVQPRVHANIKESSKAPQSADSPITTHIYWDNLSMPWRHHNSLTYCNRARCSDNGNYRSITEVKLWTRKNRPILRVDGRTMQPLSWVQCEPL